MSTDSPWTRWAGLLLAAAQLCTGCASLPPSPGRGMNLRYTSREAAASPSAQGSSVEPPRAPVSPRPSPFGEPERQHRHRATRETQAEVDDPGDATGAARQSALAAQLAFRGAVLDVSGSTRRFSGVLSRLKASERGITAGISGVFIRYVEYGERQLRWIDAELAASSRLASAASEVGDPEMQHALLRLAGPRLEAAMMGSHLLAAWLDFLNLVDVVLKQGFISVEMLFVKMDRLQKMLEPSMTALSSLEPGQVEAAAKDIPALMSHLSGEFNSTCETARVAMKRGEQAMLLAQLVEMVTMISAMRFSLPPSAPATVGLSLVVGGDGVMMGARMVVSAEWVEMMHRLVQAGVLSFPVVSATVRIQAGQVMMAQSRDGLPRSVRDALGDGPEVGSMRVTGKAGAGMAEFPEHHVLPKEFREWFEQRGFIGEMDIDHFCVKLEQAHHQAVHGGGNWMLGRTWPDEWNQMIMSVLHEAETNAGRMLPPNVILKLVAREMRRYKIPMKFVPGRRR